MSEERNYRSSKRSVRDIKTSLLRRHGGYRRQSIEIADFRSKKMEKQFGDEEMSMEELPGSISSEGSSEDLACAKYIVPSQQQPWNPNQIAMSLANLPDGERLINQMGTLKGQILEQFLSDVKTLEAKKKRKFESTPSKDGANKKNFHDDVENLASSFLTWPDSWLLIASWCRNYDIVMTLLERKANVSARDGDGRTPLHLAACSGSTAIIEELLKHGGNPNEWDSQEEMTPIHYASAINDLCSLRLLIKKGGNVDAGLPGRTPLYYAVLSNATDCVEVLLRSGACPNNPQVYTETPLHVAASLGLVKSVELLLSHGADARVCSGSARSTPLHLAAEEGSSECTKLLLRAGAPCNAKNSRGQTAMHIAALAQSAETLEALILAGADANAEDDGGRTPLHTAVAKSLRGSELIRVLLQAGSLINKPDKFGYTPLHIAALNESSHIVNLLLAKGADVTARTKGGISALSFIVRRTPDVIPRFVSRMDQGISLHDHELGDVDCELRLDFRSLVPGGRGETDLMLCLVEVGQKHILEHPLCESFLYLKWLRIRKFFIFSLVFHSIFVCFFTSYITVAYLYKSHTIIIQILFWPVLIFTTLLAAKELFQLAHGIFTYAKSWENWLQWGVIISTILVLLSPISEWQYHMAAIDVLLVWTELMMVVGRFPMFGLYVQMFTQVAINFFKFTGAYICLIIGFALGFTVLHNRYKSFANPLLGLLKTIVMMSGELEFEDVFFDEGIPVRYLWTTHLLLLGFVVLVTVILTNLMVGLAVSDIQELRRCAGLERLLRRAELVAHLESMLFSKLLDHAPSKVVKAFRREALLLHPPHHCAIHVKPNDPREKRLPKELIKAVYALVSERRGKGRRGREGNGSVGTNGVSGRGGSQRASRIISATSSSDVGRQQIADLAGELRRCARSLSVKLEALASRVEAALGDSEGKAEV